MLNMVGAAAAAAAPLSTVRRLSFVDHFLSMIISPYPGCT
jgi:hypothetical protein